MTSIEQLVELAREIELTDPIDWGMLNVGEQESYEMIAASVLENYLSSDVNIRDAIMLATIIKLTVENFVLNLRLLQDRAI
jgi:hypothetical protein